MRPHRTPEGLEEHACIDQAVLNLMLDIDRQRPWSEDEIAWAISTPGDVCDRLRRLRASRLPHILPCAITDALNRLDGAGLIERRGGRATPSEVARRLNELRTL